MKKTNLLLGFVLAGAMAVSAAQPAQPNPYKKSLQNVPVLELPAKAAEIVKKAKASEREAVTADVIAAVSEIKPAVVPAVVANIVKTERTLAVTAAAVAAQYQPGLAPLTVKSLAVIAPEEVGGMVTEVCKVAPQYFQNIAIAAADVVPSANPKILAAISTALPLMKPSIDKAVAATAGHDQTVAAVVGSAVQIAGPTVVAQATSFKAASLTESGTFQSQGAAPVVGPPFHTLPGVPKEITPNNTYEVPVGGRNYAAP